MRARRPQRAAAPSPSCVAIPSQYKPDADQHPPQYKPDADQHPSASRLPAKGFGNERMLLSGTVEASKNEPPPLSY